MCPDPLLENIFNVFSCGVNTGNWKAFPLAETLFLPRSISLLRAVLRCSCHVPASNTWNLLPLSLYTGITEGRRYWKCQHHEIILPPVWNMFSISRFAGLVVYLLQGKSSWSEKEHCFSGCFVSVYTSQAFLGWPFQERSNEIPWWSGVQSHCTKWVGLCSVKNSSACWKPEVYFSFLTWDSL